MNNFINTTINVATDLVRFSTCKPNLNIEQNTPRIL